MKKHLNILVIEDNENDALLSVRSVKKEGYEVSYRVVDNPDAMQQALQQQHWDAVISDHNLPQFDSLSALNIMKERGKDIPFIIVSASIGEELAVSAMKAGAHDFVMKDSISRLGPAVERELREAKVRQDHKEARQEIQQQNLYLEKLNARMKKLLEAATGLNSCSELCEVGSLVLAEFKRVLAAEGGSIYMKRENELVRLYSLDPEHTPDVLPFPLAPDSVFGYVMERKVPVLLEDIDSEKNLHKSGWSGYTDSSLLAIPLLDRNEQVIGVISLHNKVDAPFTRQDCDLASILGSLTCEKLRFLVANASLKKQEEYYRSLIENAPSGIVMVDQEANLIYSSPSNIRMLGYQPSENLNRKILNLIHPDDQDEVKASLNEILKNPDRKITRTFRVKHRNGEWRYVEGVAQNLLDIEAVHGIIINYLDITERIKSQEDQKKLAIAVENIAEEIMVTDAQGVIVYVNPAFEKVSGYSRYEVIGKKPSILKSGEHPESFYTDLWNTISKGDVWTGTFVNKTKSGRLIRERATISPILDSHGKISGYVAVKRDRTEQEHLEVQLRQAQKMEAIGTLAGGIAHDFNNILSAITGYTELALVDMKKGKLPVQFLNEVMLASSRAKDLVSQILTFSRIHKSSRKPIRMNPVVKESLKLLRATIPTTISIDEEIAEEPIVVIADPIQIQQIIMNLCTNAYHALKHKGGQMAIRLLKVEIDKRKSDRLIGNPNPGPYSQITVSDNGAGIPHALHDRIFDPFFTTKVEGEGTGMGLSVVHGIVTSHQGGIEFSSREGMGTRFNIYLPIVELQDTGVPLEEEQSVVYRGDGQKILVVEDEKQLLDIYDRLLTAQGYQVQTTESSAEALTLLTHQPDSFDLILTDQNMPEMTGIDLIKNISKIRPHLPFIIITGEWEISQKIDTNLLSTVTFLEKPVIQKQLLKVVYEILTGSQSS